jgi:hypothetical protein
MSPIVIRKASINEPNGELKTATNFGSIFAWDVNKVDVIVVMVGEVTIRVDELSFSAFDEEEEDDDDDNSIFLFEKNM